MTLTAHILEQAQGKVRFCIDDVAPAQETLLLQTAQSQIEKSLDGSVLAFSHDETFQVIQGYELYQIHPLALAIHVAFSEHRPLLLTPDILWMTIAQGFAQHINHPAENLRSNFVNHQGKVKLVVELGSIPTLPHHWAATIQEWVLQVRDHVGADVYKLLECNFSTTTPTIRTASHVVMMDTFQKYFDYSGRCICGIPDITLLGTVEDWQSIYERVQSMAHYNLQWWTERLLPICQEFTNTAAGKPSLEFWRCIYKPKAVYAADYITGWFADLFPYLQHGLTKAPIVRNKLLEMDRCELPSVDDTTELPRRRRFSTPSNGISLHSLPLGLSQVAIKLNTENIDGKTEYDLNLVAGFIGVHQDPERGVLQPEIGWAVHENTDRFGKLLDKIQREHLTHPPIDWSNNEQNLIYDIENAKEFIQMLERFNGATLYSDSSHPWQITKYRSWEKDIISDIGDYHSFGPFIELDDGRCIAIVFHSSFRKHLFILGSRVNQFEEFITIASNILQLFERIFEAEGGYYFDSPNFVES
jgi:Domain of unknown function (DUF4419)